MNFCMHGVIVFQRNRRYAAQGGVLTLVFYKQIAAMRLYTQHPLMQSLRGIAPICL